MHIEYSSSLLKNNKDKNNNKYATTVDIIFIEKTCEENISKATFLSRYFAPSRIAYVVIPRPAIRRKYPTYVLEKLYIPTPSTVSTRDTYGNVINGNKRFKKFLSPFKNAFILNDLFLFTDLSFSYFSLLLLT